LVVEVGHNLARGLLAEVGAWQDQC
jgi:hypothetical protein